MSSKRVRARKKQRPRRSSLINSLPYDLIVDILARVPRFNYPDLSLVSKNFKSFIASPELFARRSLLGCTEPFIYVMLNNERTGENLLYILRQKANINRLVFSRLLPPKSSIVGVGSKIYVFGGLYDFKLITTVLSIDCRFDTEQWLLSLPIPMAGRVTDVIDEKIYIIGYSDVDLKNKVMAIFDTETEMWEPEMVKIDMEIGDISAIRCVVREDKMYVRDSHNSFVYIPKENKVCVGPGKDYKAK